MVPQSTGNHANMENCVVAATRPLYATATYFNTETYFDRITIGSTSYSGPTTTNGPANVQMAAGDTMSWYADGSVTFGGFPSRLLSG